MRWAGGILVLLCACVCCRALGRAHRRRRARRAVRGDGLYPFASELRAVAGGAAARGRDVAARGVQAATRGVEMLRPAIDRAIQPLPKLGGSRQRAAAERAERQPLASNGDGDCDDGADVGAGRGAGAPPGGDGRG